MQALEILPFALGCDAEAVLCYEKVLTDFKNLKGDKRNIDNCFQQH
jgi:hypothetical protein